MRAASLLLALIAPAAAAQLVPPIPVNTEALVARVEAGASAYAYGETIEVLFTLSNPTDSLAVVVGSTSCQVYFELDEFRSEGNQLCTLDDWGYPIAPRGSRTWVWRLDPRDLGLPTRSGTHRLVGYYPGLVSDTTTFEAPAFAGGTLDFGTVAGITTSDLTALRDSLQAEILYENESPSRGVSGQWRISGVSVDSTAARLAADSRFVYAQPSRQVAYRVTSDTAGEPAPAPLSLLRAYPNPASGTVTLDLGTAGPTTVEVVDALGRRVWEMATAGSLVQIDTRALAPGVYVARLVGGGASARFTVAR